jgi:hypothetical protein
MKEIGAMVCGRTENEIHFYSFGIFLMPFKTALSE